MPKSKISVAEGLRINGETTENDKIFVDIGSGEIKFLVYTKDGVFAEFDQTKHTEYVDQVNKMMEEFFAFTDQYIHTNKHVAEYERSRQQRAIELGRETKDLSQKDAISKLKKEGKPSIADLAEKEKKKGNSIKLDKSLLSNDLIASNFFSEVIQAWQKSYDENPVIIDGQEIIPRMFATGKWRELQNQEKITGNNIDILSAKKETETTALSAAVLCNSDIVISGSLAYITKAKGFGKLLEGEMSLENMKKKYREILLTLDNNENTTNKEIFSKKNLDDLNIGRSMATLMHAANVMKKTKQEKMSVVTGSSTTGVVDISGVQDGEQPEQQQSVENASTVHECLMNFMSDESRFPKIDGNGHLEKNALANYRAFKIIAYYKLSKILLETSDNNNLTEAQVKENLTRQLENFYEELSTNGNLVPRKLRIEEREMFEDFDEAIEGIGKKTVTITREVEFNQSAKEEMEQVSERLLNNRINMENLAEDNRIEASMLDELVDKIADDLSSKYAENGEDMHLHTLSGHIANTVIDFQNNTSLDDTNRLEFNERKGFETMRSTIEQVIHESNMLSSNSKDSSKFAVSTFTFKKLALNIAKVLVKASMLTPVAIVDMGVAAKDGEGFIKRATKYLDRKIMDITKEEAKKHIRSDLDKYVLKQGNTEKTFLHNAAHQHYEKQKQDRKSR